MWCHFLTFLELYGWWWLISSMFLTRTSCHKTTHEMVSMMPCQVGGFSQSASPNGMDLNSVQFSSVQFLSRVLLFVTP